MKGKSYRILNYILLALALAATIFLIVKGDAGGGNRGVVCALVCVAAAVVQVHYLVHELGHLLVGLLVNFRAVSFSVGFLRLSRMGRKLSFIPNAAVAGACEMYPVGEKHLKGRVIAYSFGGAAFNFLFAAAALLCYFLLPASWGMLLFAALAPLNLYEGIMELLPADLSAGKTDGCLVRDIMKGESTATVTLAVFRAQGILAKGSVSDLPRKILYDVPVIREDEPVFLSLLQLRMMKATLDGDSEEAIASARRLMGLSEYIPAFEAGELAADCASVLWLFGEETELSEDLLKAAKGSCAVLRIRSIAGDEIALKKWKKAAKKLPMKGQREWEVFFMARLKESGLSADEK